MKRLVVPVIVAAWVTSVMVAIGGAVAFAERVDTEQLALEQELAALKHEHAALQEWVAKELRPWVIDQAEVVAEVIPSGSPTPSVEPLAPVPTPSPIPSASPSPSPTDIPLPTPTPTPTPSDLCLPVICLPSPSTSP